MITATQFYESFKKVNRQFLSENSKIHQAKEWTRIMLSKGGIIEQAAEALECGPIHFQTEFYRYDAAIFDNSDHLAYNKIRYRQPASILALIEHENGRNPEEEFWKLIHFYAQLKVLIFYSPNPEGFIQGCVAVFTPSAIL